MLKYCGLFLCLFFLVSCGSKTVVILLPDADGKTGSVVVKNKSSSTILDQPYTYTDVKDDTSRLMSNPIDEKAVNEEYRFLFEKEPLKPVYFILYFEDNSLLMTKESLKLVQKAIEVAKQREPSEVSIIGHSDTKGSSEYNNDLALKRAQAVQKEIHDSGVALKGLMIKSHGEHDPLVKTADKVSEPKNRRVEIMIR